MTELTNISTRTLTISGNETYVARVSSSNPQLPLRITVRRYIRPSFEYFFNYSFLLPASLMDDGLHSFDSLLKRVRLPFQEDNQTCYQFPTGDVITVEENRTGSVLITGLNYSPLEMRVYISALPFLDYTDDNGTYYGEIANLGHFGFHDQV